MSGSVHYLVSALGFNRVPVQHDSTIIAVAQPSRSTQNAKHFRGLAAPNVTDWQYLNLNYVTKARIDQDACIKCGRCYAACEDTSHQAISMSPDRVFEVQDDECVACNLCVDVCPVENCITMVELQPGEMDKRTGKPVPSEYANWTTHPNNPAAQAAE